ncbi:MAG: Nif3-like dinuclear metal center hexameric protein [Chitinophagales bacterium]
MSLKISDITQCIESIAPLRYQESYDNAGLLVGDANAICSNALLCLDSTEAVVDEAIEKGCNLIIAHHPIIFGGLKKLTGRTYIERTVIKAIQNNIAIYAAHTNLDNVLMGVNRKICDKLGLQNCKILAPKRQLLKKLQVFCPLNIVDTIKFELLKAGGSFIENCQTMGFSAAGSHTLDMPNDKAARTPSSEVKLEMTYAAPIESRLLRVLVQKSFSKQLYYNTFTLDNVYQNIGSGMIGELPAATKPTDFLMDLKTKMKTDCVRYTALPQRKIRKIAVCGGVGSFLLPKAISQGADVFVTADYKYHQFFDADNRIVIADIGHYESEQFTVELFYDLLTKKFSNFEPILSSVNTNPIKYL